MIKNYYESLLDENILNNRTAEKLMEFYNPYECTQILRRYNIGSAKDNEPAFWYTDENGTPYALQVKKQTFFNNPGIWNIEALKREQNTRKVGICDTPEQAFWANLYLRHWAIWIACGQGTDFSILKPYNCFAVIPVSTGATAQFLRNIPGIRFYEYNDFKEELFVTGIPKRYVQPHTYRVRSSHFQKVGIMLQDEELKKLMKEFDLELV